MTRKVALSSPIMIGALLLSTAAWAQSTATITKGGTGMEKVDSQTAPPPTGLMGDWGGLRTQLHDSGIDTALGARFGDCGAIERIAGAGIDTNQAAIAAR